MVSGLTCRESPSILLPFSWGHLSLLLYYLSDFNDFVMKSDIQMLFILVSTYFIFVVEDQYNKFLQLIYKFIHTESVKKILIKES